MLDKSYFFATNNRESQRYVLITASEEVIINSNKKELGKLFGNKLLEYTNNRRNEQISTCPPPIYIFDSLFAQGKISLDQLINHEKIDEVIDCEKDTIHSILRRTSVHELAGFNYGVREGFYEPKNNKPNHGFQLQTT